MITSLIDSVMLPIFNYIDKIKTNGIIMIKYHTNEQKDKDMIIYNKRLRIVSRKRYQIIKRKFRIIIIYGTIYFPNSTHQKF